MNFQKAIDRMPQKGVMCLIEEVLSADETSIKCRAKDHRNAGYPLRIAGQLMTASLVELGAQAAAAHASLYCIGAHHAGMLLALHNVEIREPEGGLADAPLESSAERVHFNETGARYRFAVHYHSSEVLSGDAVLMMQAVNP
jgi:predicted hotdog family 3-hydroxylacyl-ACP dehydratase